MRISVGMFTVVVALAIPLILPVRGQTPSLAEGLAKAMAQWSGIRPAAYEFKLQPICGMCPPYPPGKEPKFVVREGVGKQINGEADELASYATVEDQFVFIASQVERRVVKIELAYDSQLGYPIRAYFDPTTLTTDDEYGFKVIEFKILANRAHSLPNIGLQPAAFDFVAHSLR